MEATCSSEMRVDFHQPTAVISQKTALQFGLFTTITTTTIIIIIIIMICKV
jgi:hypothetical protein